MREKERMIACPDMVKLNYPQPYMREECCLLRLQGENNDCIRKCKAVDHLRVRLKLPPAIVVVKTKLPRPPEPARILITCCECGAEFRTTSRNVDNCYLCRLKGMLTRSRSKKCREELQRKIAFYEATAARKMKRLADKCAKSAQTA